MVFTDRVSAYPNRYILTDADGNASYVVLERADEPIAVGTPLNAETFNAMLAEFINMETLNARVAEFINAETFNAKVAELIPASGGTMTGNLGVKGLTLTADVDYGDTLPPAGTPGRLFFKKVSV